MPDATLELLPERTEARVDYLTYTTPAGEADGRLEALQSSLLYAEAQRGNLIREGYRWGYWTRSAGSVVAGRREDGYLTVLSGDVAAGNWLRLARLPGRPTRLDLAVTSRLSLEAPGYIEALYDGWEARPKVFNEPRCAQLIRGSDGGSTMYLGAPSSDVRLRIYDHGVAHGYDVPGKCLRWEVQYRNEPAQRALPTCLSATVHDAAIGGLVHALLSDRQLEPPWSYIDVRAKVDNRRRTDVDRKLEWLRSQVAPTIEKLADLGYYEEAIEALGLSGVL